MTERLVSSDIEKMQSWLDQLEHGGPAQHALLGNPPFPAQVFARRAIATIQHLNEEMNTKYWDQVRDENTRLRNQLAEHRKKAND